MAKIRLGFVSNSSSSSFIISTQLSKQRIKDGELTMTLTVPVDGDIIDKIISTEKELHEYFEDYHGLSIEEMREEKEDYGAELEQLKNLEPLLSNGQTVVIGSCSNEDPGISSYLHYNGFDGVVIHNGSVIESEDY